eukprot:scaffold3148_cov343-Prasinococcus_capsulatus_cf.AAC.4
MAMLSSISTSSARVTTLCSKASSESPLATVVSPVSIKLAPVLALMLVIVSTELLVVPLESALSTAAAHNVRYQQFGAPTRKVVDPTAGPCKYIPRLSRPHRLVQSAVQVQRALAQALLSCTNCDRGFRMRRTCCSLYGNGGRNASRAAVVACQCARLL